MQKKLLTAAICGLSLVLSGCAADSNRYRSDVYNAGQVNQAQEVHAVQIISVTPAQVAVSNEENTDRAQMIGAVLGAIAGAAIGNHGNHSTSSRVLGGLAGGAVGGIAGNAATGMNSTSYADGVQIVFKTPEGKLLQSAQVGRICEFKVGSAVVITSKTGETRVQPNNPYGCAAK